MVRNDTLSKNGGNIGAVLQLSLVVITAIFAIFFIDVTGITYIPHLVLLHSNEGLKAYYGDLYTFAIFLGFGLTFLTFATARRDKWYILSATILGYLTCGIACIFYGFMFETKLWVNQLEHATLYDFFMIDIIIAPFVSGAWIAGALAGWLYVVLEKRCITMKK